ncbi:MAG: hypothetical protein DMD35_21400 [Gemmatimonadetes bacterium]|nr:MAG: hypothetical protein DMD35_21400 [Gemmatimonadota bacterium]
MAMVSKKKGALTVNAYVGDAKTLLAFNLPKAAATNLAGFTIETEPDGLRPYYLYNTLQFKKPSQHAKLATEPAYSSINAPIHKFRWVHIPGSMHQGLSPFMGKYTYTVTPRYFDANESLLPLDPKLSVSLVTKVLPFTKGRLALGFTRGFTQSQAFSHHFSEKASYKPEGAELLFDTSAEAGVNAKGVHFTFAQEYAWSGFTARKRIFELVEDVVQHKSLHLDMFAYDLNEPDLLKLLLTLAAQGRVRLLLDNAGLHHNATKPKAEDEFEQLFRKKMKGDADIKRGHFSSYAHDKVLLVSNASGPVRVLTGSTNFSLTGMYVNSNHVIVFDDPTVTAKYAEVFESVWVDGAKTAKFQQSPLSGGWFPFGSTKLPKMEISFAPHTEEVAGEILDGIAKRITSETKAGKKANVLFAIMDIGRGDGPVRPALIALHAQESAFSLGISDTVSGIKLYKPGRRTGVLVTGKPANTILPPPFDQVARVRGHQVHHKFVVCGFNTADPVVYCGSSNLAAGGEAKNGDNLLAIRDPDVVTAFAIEAVALVDHFQFLDNYQRAPKGKKTAPPKKQDAAAEAGWYLSTGDRWTLPYFDPKDLHSMDRELFG